MNRVISTKTPKMEMLIVGLPIASSAASTSATGHPSGRGATGRELVVLQPLTHLVRDRVGRARRMPYVERRDHEGRHELEQAQDDAEVDVAEDRRLHEAGGIGREQDVEQVPGEEGHGHREGEAPEPPPQLGELRRVLRRAVLLRREQPPVVRWSHWSALLC